MLVNLDHGGADLGWDYDASLDDVEAFLTKEDATLRCRSNGQLAAQR
jgi:hypothetical protein